MTQTISNGGQLPKFPFGQKELEEAKAAFLEDILATAELREVRTFPKEEWMYVRVAVRFLNKDAEWGNPFQIVALWDCFKKLQGYTFVAEPIATEYHPEEIDGEETEAQRLKRQALRENREQGTR